MALAVHRCLKPVIAAMNGSAVGVGVTMTLPMNIRVVSEKAKIGFVFARRGIVMEVWMDIPICVSQTGGGIMLICYVY